MRLRLLIAYDGSGFNGWQIQEKPAPPPTIQGELERALAALCRCKIRVFGSGRTDAGVHAQGQVAHCDLPDNNQSLGELHYRLNALLPQKIRVLDVAAADASFHARKDALSKTYLYQLWTEPRFIPPLLAPQYWNCGPVDQVAMHKALPLLLGERDFASLRNAGTESQSSVRKIIALSLVELAPQAFYPPHLPALCISVTANGFLKQMVRNIAGLLVYCGKGRLNPAGIPQILGAKDRRALPSATAPAWGLTLARVDYAACGTCGTCGAGEIQAQCLPGHA